MSNVPIFTLLVFIARCHAEEPAATNTVSRLVDKLFKHLLVRAPQISSIQYSQWDSTTLGKPSNLVTPQRVGAFPRSSSLPAPASSHHPVHPLPIRRDSTSTRVHKEESSQLLQSGPGGRRAMISALLAAAFSSGQHLAPPAAIAYSDAGEDISLSDITEQKVPCPKGIFLPQRGKWECIEISATADNQVRKEVKAAKVFGKVYDNEGSLVLSNLQDEGMRLPIASLGAVPKGKSQVKFILTSAANAPRPLRLVAFKAVYSNPAIENQYKPFDPCELDPDSCDANN